MAQITDTALDDGAEIFRGADFRREYKWLDPLGAVVDLTGATGEVEFLRAGVPLLTGTVTITNAAQGEFAASVDRAQILTKTPIVRQYGGLAQAYLDQYEQLIMNIRITVGGLTYPVIHGPVRFYP